MRSPRSVFERLQQVIESSYEQDSKRENEADTLLELFVDNPSEQLHSTLHQLSKEGISSQSIMVIYWQDPPQYKPGFEALVRCTFSVFKCRGLESPVVIVLADSNIKDDVALACAYTRATDRCIVIYNRYAFLTTHPGRFYHILVQESPSVKQWKEESAWPSLHGWLLSHCAFTGADISWSQLWEGWYVQGTQNDEVAKYLSMMHVLFTSSFPVYINGPALFTLKAYLPKSSFSEKLESSPILCSWCNLCNRWERTMKEDQNVLSLDHRFIRNCATPKEGDSYQLLEKDLVSQTGEIEGETLFSLVLRRWLQLSQEQKDRLLPYCGIFDENNSTLWITRIITGIEIVTAIPGSLLSNAHIQQDYWNLCPWLENTHFDRQEWNRSIASNMGTWFGLRKWLQKKERGIYLSIPLPI